MAQLSYTTGNWAVASHEVDTIATPKNVAVVDLDYAHDFSVASATSSEARLLNTSGTSLEPVEKLRYAKERVADIYRNSDVPKSAQLASPVGTRVLAESIELITGSNTVSGEEKVIPLRVWTCIESSTAQMVTGDALIWALKRHIGQLLATGTVDASLILSLFRGDLNPTA